MGCCAKGDEGLRRQGAAPPLLASLGNLPRHIFITQVVSPAAGGPSAPGCTRRGRGWGPWGTRQRQRRTLVGRHGISAHAPEPDKRRQRPPRETPFRATIGGGPQQAARPPRDPVPHMLASSPAGPHSNQEANMNILLSTGKIIPVEMHKIRIVQRTTLPTVRRRLDAIGEAGYNTFLLRTRDVFLDMLTDSGTNAMSDNQLAAMMVSDDAYAGSESFYKLADAVKDVLGMKYLLPVHQGRAAEHLLAKVFVKPGDVVLMNYHFTTTKAHMELAGATVSEIYTDEALNTQSGEPFRGNLAVQKFKEAIERYGPELIPFF